MKAKEDKIHIHLTTTEFTKLFFYQVKTPYLEKEQCTQDLQHTIPQTKPVGWNAKLQAPILQAEGAPPRPNNKLSFQHPLTVKFQQISWKTQPARANITSDPHNKWFTQHCITLILSIY